jgi:carboxypeptidase family protein
MILALSPPQADAKAHLDEKGRFELALQRPGLYRVSVSVGTFGVFVLPGQLALESRELEPLVLPEAAPGPPRSEPADEAWRRGNYAEARWSEFDGAPPARDLPVHQIRVLTPAGSPAPGVILVDAAHRRAVGKTDKTGSAKTLSAPRLLLLGEDGGVQTFTPAGASGDGDVILEPGVHLRGVVSDSLTGKPIPKALLWIASDPGRAVFTDNGGQYSILVPRRELETLHVAAAEHVISAALLHPRAMGAVAKYNVELGSSVAISGFVLDSSGKGIPRASISAGGFPGIDPVARPPSAGRVASGIGGQFGLSSLAPTRKYQLTVEALGYLPTTATAVSPQVGKAFEPLRITLAPSASAKGRVVDGNGKVLAGVEVLLRPSRDLGAASRMFEKIAVPRPTRRELKFLTSTTSAGTFRIPSIPASRFDVVASKAGYSPAVVHGVVATAGAREVAVPEIKMRPGAAIEGMIVDPDGKPIRGAVINLVAELGRLDTLQEHLAANEPDAVSDAKGVFKIADLPAASTYNLLAGAVGFLPKGVRGIRPGGHGIPIHLQRAAQLTGRTIDEQGQPIAGTHIEIDSRRSLPDFAELEIGETTSRRVTSGADGTFIIRDAPEGHAVLVASHRGYVPSDSIDVEIPQPDDSGITITLSKGATVAGKITSSAGHALEDASILVASETRASSLEDGSYEVSGVPLGNVTVEVTAACCKSVTRDVVVTAGPNVVDIELESGSRVAGAAFDANEDPVPAAAIRLSSSQRGRGLGVYDTYTDADGRFELASVPAGDYRLQAAKEGFAVSAAPALVAVSGADITDLRVVMQPSGTIQGGLLGLSPEDFARVQVHATKSPGGSLVGQVSADSHFLVEGLGEGDWIVSAAIDDGREAHARVTLGPGDTATQDLRFFGLSLTGAVSYRGESLEGAVVSIRGSQFSSRRSATTDWQGNFAIRNLRQDTYWLGVSSRDALVVHNEMIDLESDADIAINIDATTVRGRVTDSTTDAPIASAYASVRPREGPDFMIGAGTEADGQFALPQVPSGNYTLFVEADGYSDARQAISVSDRAAADTVEISLDPVPGLALQVAIAGRPAPALTFLSASSAEGGGGAPVTQVITPDSSGVAHASRLSAGRWRLAIGAPGAALQDLEATIPNAAPYRVVLSPAGKMQIRVPDLVSSDEIASAHLVSQTGALLRSFGEGLVLQDSWQLEGGAATVDGVPFGIWQVAVTTSAGMTKHGSVEVTSTGLTPIVLP